MKLSPDLQRILSNYFHRLNRQKGSGHNAYTQEQFKEMSEKLTTVKEEKN